MYLVVLRIHGGDPTHGGTIVRTRLVAFGRSPVNNLNTISLTHIFNTMVRQLE